MLIIELRWLLIGLLLMFVAALGIGIYLGQRNGQKTGKAISGGSILRDAVRFLLHPNQSGQNEENLEKFRSAAATGFTIEGLHFYDSNLEDAPFGLLVLDQTGKYHHANAYTRRLLGMQPAPSQLPETNWAELLMRDNNLVRMQESAFSRYRSVSITIPESDLAPLLASEQSQKEPISPDQGIGGNGSSKTVRWWLKPMGEMSLVLIMDFTAQHNSEEASRHLVNDLSHELRTPLATILTHLEVLGLSNLSPEIQRQSVHLLKDEANRMVRLINQMLEIGRLETSLDIGRKPLDLLALVERIIGQISQQASSLNIELALEADSPLPHIFGDADRIQQVFLNLIDNAIKYSRPGDRVVISLSKATDSILCGVQDTGPGILAEHLPHITERFYRVAPREVAGSGLGLALVDEILRRHNSELHIESQTQGENTGTTVSFRLSTNRQIPNEALKQTKSLARS